MYKDCEAPGAHRAEHGATAVEYALMAALIALVIVAAVALIGPPLGAIFSNMATSL